MPVCRMFVAALSLVPLTACMTQSDYHRPALVVPAAWSNGPPTLLFAAPHGNGADWWSALGDPAINRLVAATLSGNPTLEAAAARIDQAATSLANARGQRLPRVDLAADVTHARTGTFGNGTLGGTVVQNTAAIGPTLSWELDLWGRVRQTVRAARSRLDARSADAADARLSIVAQVATAVLDLRACNYALGVRDRDIASRDVELAITRRRLQFGSVAPVDVANGRSNLATARTDRIAQQEQCLHIVDALVALSGVEAVAIRGLIPAVLPAPAPAADASPVPIADVDMAAVMPAAPPLLPGLPATVLLSHPTVVAAEREAAARWAEIGVARAERLPSINLAAVLTGQWLSALGSSISYIGWSLEPSLSAPLFDGGAGAARVRGAQARYREAVAMLVAALRNAAQAVEDALATQQSALDRLASSREAVAAARLTLQANEARWQAGAISLFELEDSRRQFNRSQNSAIAAARDRAQAWVELVRRTGPAFNETPSAANAAYISKANPG